MRPLHEPCISSVSLLLSSPPHSLAEHCSKNRAHNCCAAMSAAWLMLLLLRHRQTCYILSTDKISREISASRLASPFSLSPSQSRHLFVCFLVFIISLLYSRLVVVFFVVKTYEFLLVFHVLSHASTYAYVSVRLRDRTSSLLVAWLVSHVFLFSLLQEGRACVGPGHRWLRY